MKSIRMYILVLGILVSVYGRAQVSEAYPQPPVILARISMIIPKLIVEMAPSETFTFTTGVMIRPTFREEGPDGESRFRPLPNLNPRIYLEPRFFFNQGHRTAKGKRRDYYSGWYVGMPFSLGFPEKQFSMGTTMGFQCTFGRRWYWNVEVGPAMHYKEQRFTCKPFLDAGFGIILN